MRIPFLRRKPMDIKSQVASATIIPSGEAALPRSRNGPRTLEESRALGERSRRRRANGGAPS
jgi:hypothetical protein